MQMVRIYEVPGIRANTFVYKDVHDNVYWIKQKKPSYYILKCSKWRSSDQNCPAKGKIMLPDMETLWLYKSHKHCNKNKKLLATFRKTLIDRATREQTNHRIIFNEVCARPEFRSLNVPYKMFKRQMSKAKKENLPPEPNSMLSFKNQMLNDFAEKVQIEGESIFIGQTGNLEDGISLVFIVPKLKRLLRSGIEFVIDGTFKASPKFRGECCQLFVIMGMYMDNGFPIVYSLMSNKTETSYIHLFSYLKNILKWNPKCISVDFEHSSIAAMKSVFSDINMYGCWFHHSQCVWRHIQKKGLTDLCRRNRTAYDIVHMLMAIPLLPKDKTFEGFENILQFYVEELHSVLSITNRHNMKSLLRYYYNTWIIGNLSSIMSVNNRVRRTNNHLEVSHMHLMKHIQHPNPSPWIFLEKLITFMKGITNDFSLVQDGIEIRHEQPKKWKKQDKKIHIATKKLRYERFSVFEFLLYTRHTTPNFGMDRPTNNSFEEIEEHNITTHVIHCPDASLPTSSLLIGSDVEESTPNATSTPNHMAQISFDVEEDIQNLNTSPLVNSPFGYDVEVSTANATWTPNHMDRVSFNVEEDIQNLNTSPLVNSPFGSDVEVSTANATSTPNHMAQISFNIEEDIQNLNTSPLVNSPFGSDVEVSTANATSTPNHMAQISFNVEEDIQNLNTSPLVNSPFGSDVEVSTANATSTPNHMAQISFNVEEDIQNLNTSPLINSSLGSDVEEVIFSLDVSLPAPIVSPNSADVEVVHSPIPSPIINVSQFNNDVEDNDLQEEIDLSGDSSLSPIWTPRVVMLPPTIVTPPSEIPLLPIVPQRVVSPIIEIELNLDIRRQVCVACLNEDCANAKIFPCEHICLCGDCVQHLEQNVCPLCRSPIEKIIIYI